ncbi:MAG: hypothetical protein ACTSYJ_06325 [Candidatus Thorarchaeota archaeon]
MAVRWSEKRGNASDFELPLLSQLEGEEFAIYDVRFGNSKFGEYAVVSTEGWGTYRTSSTVLLSDLHEIKRIIDETNESVIVKLVKQKNYYIFQ